ncbi:Uncharacterised protein [Mycobacteroides abscessus subsp. abscessus]|nr:Uncharacterised protein [Mycobacteroides abscessus subsp. abscessus]
MDPAIEVAIAGQDGGGLDVIRDDFRFDVGIERAGHAVAGRAAETDDAEAQFLQWVDEAG